MVLVINLSHKLEDFREDGEKGLANLIAEHPSEAERIDDFLKKVLAVPKRVWFLLFVVRSRAPDTYQVFSKY